VKNKNPLYIGAVLIILQILDGYLTLEGIARWGNKAEGNPILLWLLESSLNPFAVIVGVKVVAILIICLLTDFAYHSEKLTKYLIAIAIFYMSFAILPWTYVLTK